MTRMWRCAGLLPADELTVSERDAGAPRLAEVADELPFRWHP